MRKPCAADGNSDLTIDFGFTTRLGVGNLVFLDANASGTFNSTTEAGVAGVQVEAVRMSGVIEQGVVASAVTGTDGRYLIYVQPGFSYKLRIPASQFASGAPLAGQLPSAVLTSGHDDSHNQDGQPVADPAANGVCTAVVTLALGTQPTDSDGRETGFHKDSDNTEDSNVNLTLDFGFHQPLLGVGNLVFNDLNDNGRYDSGEGVDGVWMLLLEAGAANAANPIASTFTANGGRYLFDNLLPGSYVVHVAADNFKQNVSIGGGPQGPGPLYGKLSVIGTAGVSTDDNFGEDGIDVTQPDQVGINSGVVTLAYGTEPTDANTELGAFNTSDNALDANTDLTVDFGFKATAPPVNLRVGNMVFEDLNNNSSWDAGEGIGGVTVQLFAFDANPLVDLPLASTTTITSGSGAGSYLFENVAPGSYFVFLPPSNFATFGAPLLRKTSLLGHQGGAFQPSMGDDNTGEDGIDDQKPEINGIRSTVFAISAGSAPAGTIESGYAGMSDEATDADVNLTVDFGFRTRLGFGNLVFKDMNDSGAWGSASDAGAPGVIVELVKTTGSTDIGVAATTVTDSAGKFILYAPPGTYKLRVPASQFGPGGVLYEFIPGTLTGTGFDDDANQDAQPASNPEVTGVSTVSYSFGYGAQPSTADGKETGLGNTADDAEDTNVNLTLDLGFIPKFRTVGNMVFKDSNSNSRYDPGLDLPLAGVTIKLFNQGANVATDTPVATTQSAVDGTYILKSLTPGPFFIHVPASNFQAAASGALVGLKASPTAGSTTSAMDDNFDQNAISVNSPSVAGISTASFYITKNVLPVDSTGSTGETGFAKTMDNNADTWGNMTIDLGFEVAPQGFPLAGRVRRDLGGSGDVADAGAPLQGVEITLYEDVNSNGAVDAGETSAIATTTTNAEGEYAFESILEGEYLVVQSALPGATTTYDTDGGDAACTCIMLDGEGSTDLDFMQCLSPDTFAQWQQQNALDGHNAAGDNPDGDLYSNLLEYALGTDAATGLGAERFRVEKNATTGAFDAMLVRGISGHTDVSYKIEAASSLVAPVAWSTLNLTPSSVPSADGTQTLRFADLESAMGGAADGFVRLKVSLDADHNGAAEAVAHSPVFAFARREFAAGQQSFSMPLLSRAVFTGAVTAVDGATISLAVGAGSIRDQLAAGTEYYAEVISGPHAGHRLEIDESGSTDGAVVVDVASDRGTLAAVPASLAGARVSVRPHWTAAALFPAAEMQSAATAAAADRLLFFDNATNKYQALWLYAAGTSARWVRDGDATLASRDARVVLPGEGLLVHARNSAVTLAFAGQVRATDFALPLKSGAQLIGNGYPVARSADARGFDATNGFTAGQDALGADRVRLWLGDATPGESGYETYFLHEGESAQWVKEGDASFADESATTIFDAFRAAFITLTTAKPAHVEQAP